jgi:hypothetical protein
LAQRHDPSSDYHANGCAYGDSQAATATLRRISRRAYPDERDSRHEFERITELVNMLAAGSHEAIRFTIRRRN